VGVLAGSGVAVFVGDSVGVLAGAAGGNGVGVGDSTLVGADVGAAQASKLAANINIRGISISGTIDLRFISLPSLVFNHLRFFYHADGYIYRSP
jgi:hypothetical protein